MAKDQTIQEAESKAHAYVSETADKVSRGIDDASEGYQKASKKAEAEVNRLKAELAELRAKAAPKIQEAEHFLTSPAAIQFYKGLVTGVALVMAYQKYTTHTRY
ncbi:hypothetical protein BY458DRAFT_531767 [Sporodiniella umbellata]|nr:hypothetical protein BY458DRAFT_531767 [Sporodiniella umbellata]